MQPPHSSKGQLLKRGSLQPCPYTWTSVGFFLEKESKDGDDFPRAILLVPVKEQLQKHDPHILQFGSPYDFVHASSFPSWLTKRGSGGDTRVLAQL